MLPAAAAAKLLTKVPILFGCGINDLLLTALALTIARWRRGASGKTGKVLLNAEGHGREEVFPKVDLSRTVGWFTTLYPVRLDIDDIDPELALAGGEDLERAVGLIKSRLRAVPGHGLGYGLLRYLHPEAAADLGAYPAPEIAFNYLGRLTLGAAGEDWGLIQGGLGGEADETMPLAHAIEINAVTRESNGPELVAHWLYAPALISDTEVRELADGWIAALEQMASRATAAVPAMRPTDLPAAVTAADLDHIARTFSTVHEVLPLAPLQEGMLFHALYDRQGLDVYVTQFELAFDGRVSHGRLRRAIAALGARHPQLCAAFLHEGLSRPAQVIPRHPLAAVRSRPVLG